MKNALTSVCAETFMCEHFFRAIYLRIKEEPTFTCVSGACDNYTMVCICFSWAPSPPSLTLGERGPVGNCLVSPVVKSDILLLHKELQAR